jgi:hypothetical protein
MGIEIQDGESVRRLGPIGAGRSSRYRGRMPNFVLLDTSQPDITQLLVAMLQARQAVARRSWSHPQQAAGEDWWADVLADPRARKRGRRVDKAIKQATYRLADEPRATILVACSKCDWKAAYGRNDLIASHSAECPMPVCSTSWRSQDVHGSEINGIIAGCITLSRSEP